MRKNYQRKERKSNHKFEVVRGQELMVRVPLPMAEVWAEMQAQVEELTGQAGLQILRAILENEVTRRVGPPHRPNPTAGCVRWGKQPGYDHCLRSQNYINAIVAGKQPALQWLDMKSAIEHCTNGIGIWQWASNDNGSEPDVVMACAGDVPTLETLAAVDLLRRNFPDIKIRVVNVGPSSHQPNIPTASPTVSSTRSSQSTSRSSLPTTAIPG